MSSKNISIPSIPSVGLNEVTDPGSGEDSALVVHANIYRLAGEAALFAELAPQHGIRAVVITDPNKAATVYEAEAHRNIHNGITDRKINPIDYGHTARQVVKDGGALVQFSYPRGSDLSSLYHAVEAAQDAGAPTPQVDV